MAGISIGMISGDNSILGQAGNAKKQTDIAGEKEILQTSVVYAMGKSKYGDLTKDKLDDELDKNIGRTNYSSELVEGGIQVTFNKSGREYLLDSDGNLTTVAPTIRIADSKVVTNANGTGEDVTQHSKIEGTDTLYISFKPTIAGGSITSVTYNGNNITAQNGIYVLEINKNGDYDFTINGIVDEKTITSPYTKNVDKYQFWGGIQIGDYVTYVPETKSAYSNYLKSTYTGHPSNQTLTQEYKTWRVLNIDRENGKLTIVPAYNSEDLPSGKSQFKLIYFYMPVGYNNAVFLLHDMCNYLYANEEKGITARNINYEDITGFMKEGTNDTEGLKKIEKYQKDQVTNAHSNYGKILAKDMENNAITYKETNLYYPEIYRNQEGAGINIYSESQKKYTGTILQRGAVGVHDESDKVYTAPTSNNTKNSVANNLTVKCTDYNGKIESSDFKNSAIYNVLFFYDVDDFYWVASRCVGVDSDRSIFGLRTVVLNSQNISENIPFTSYGNGFDNGASIFPLVTLESNVKVNKCTGANSIINRHTVDLSE